MTFLIFHCTLFQIFRHGERNIVFPTYPNDPHKDEIHWPGGSGQLTKVLFDILKILNYLLEVIANDHNIFHRQEGIRQQYRLGQYFRRRYGKILDVKYSPNNVHIQSTDFDRKSIP